MPWELHSMSYSHYAVIRDGKELTQVHVVSFYTQEVDPPQLTFYDDSRIALKVVPAEAGDVIRPVVVGFFNPFEPIDQSESRIRELRQRLASMQKKFGW